MSQEAARRYREIMAEDLHLNEMGHVVLKRTGRLGELDILSEEMTEDEQIEADRYIAQLATFELSLEQFVKDTFPERSS